jgi:hypothetical protein
VPWRNNCNTNMRCLAVRPPDKPFVPYHSRK